jgi:hypothetical protein
MRYIPVILAFLFHLNLNGQIEQNSTSQSPEANQVTDIVVVFKMHVDIGYTNWAEGVLQKYSHEMLEETLRSIEMTSSLPKSEQFVWTIPGWPLKYMLDHCSPENKIRLDKAIEDGRIVPHALPFTFETEASDLENLVRGLSITSGINKSYGLPQARDAKQTDVPSHSHALPTVLKNAGVDFLHLGCNPGSASPDVPVLFWWQGPDGSKLLTFYWAEYYGSGILPPEGWPHKTWLAMIHTHENTGAPDPGEVAELLKTAREELPGVNIKIGRLSDFYDLLMKEEPELPIIQGDMPDTWIHGYMSNPRETSLSKQLQKETYHTEILNSQLNQWGITERSISDDIDDAMEQMILYEEHTFGAAMSHGNQHKWTYGDEFRVNKSLGNYDYIEGTWIEKRNRIRSAEKIVMPLMKQQLKSLASAVNADGKRIVVYNPLPWDRSGRVSFFAGVYQKKFQIHALKDAVSGNIIPVYEDYNLISFHADSVPSMGYKTYIPIMEPMPTESSLILDREQQVLENSYFRIRVNELDGSLSSVWDKIRHKELVNQKDTIGFAHYFLEKAGQDQIDAYNAAYVKPGAEGWANDEMIRTSVPMKKQALFTGSCEKILWKNMGNAIRTTVFGTLDDPDSQRYVITYTLYENEPYIEIAWGVDGKRPNPHPEAGWLSFSFNMDEPEYRLYRTGGIVDPQSAFIKNTNHDFFFLNTSMAIYSSAGGGIALNSPSSPGISLDQPGLFSFSGSKPYQTGKVFVNLYTNQWGTNFTEWIEGSFSSKLYLWSFGGYDPEASFITPSEETRSPLKGVFYDGPAGSGELSQQGITLSRKGILLTAFKKLPGQEGMLLRLWEQSGQNGSCLITLPEGSAFTKAYRCNLRDEIIDSVGIPVENLSFQMDIQANQPVSFVLK